MHTLRCRSGVDSLFLILFLPYSSREGDPFTAIVDGANVAYFGFATMHFSQVKRVVDELKRMGENPLVILPKKYTNRKFLLSRRRHLQTLDDRDYAVIKR